MGSESTYECLGARLMNGQRRDYTPSSTLRGYAITLGRYCRKTARADPTLLSKQRARLAEQLAAMAGIQEEIKQKQSERAGVESRIAQLDATLPLITEEADSNKKLMGSGMVHTVGGVVTEAQPLMLLVPDDSPIEVEAMISNKDIGFIHEGQEAIVKIETFNFTKYGFVPGTVRKVSHDAIGDKDHGLIYTAHIILGQTVMEVDGNTLQLAPGMAVSAEVKTGRRRVIEFLLSPLLRYQNESGRER